jgi:hypothetical protein
MAAKLIVTGGLERGREEPLSGVTLVLGRGSACDIVFADAQVSRRHAELHLAGEQWTVRDLQSINGTFVNGRQLGPNESHPLRPGDQLKLGPNVELTLAEVSPAPEAGLPPAEPPVAQAGGRAIPIPLIIGAAAVLILLIAAVIFLARGGLAGLGPGKSTATLAAPPTGSPAPGAPSVTPTLPAIVTQQPPSALPELTPLPTIAIPTVAVPTVPLPTIPKPAALVTTALTAVAARPEEIPAIVAAAFPGVMPEQLPAAIQQALQAGQVPPETARVFIEALFPGVPLLQLPTALAGSFAGFNQQQIEQILKTIYPGQNLTFPKIEFGQGQIVFAALDEGGQRIHIYQMNADGTGKKLLIEDASEPAFSPDGSRLVYVSWRGDTRGLRIREMQSGAERQLTSLSDDAYPTWAPHGGRIAFWNVRDNMVLTINLDGSDRRVVTRGEFPAWSPAGDRIALKGCVDNHCGIVLVNPDGTNPVRITTNSDDGQPAWSPNGRSIAFVSNRDGNWEIYAINADGSWLRRVTTDPHTDGLPAWASDGIRIAFRSDRSGVWAIYTATGVGGPPIKLTDAAVQDKGEWRWTREKISWR